MAISVIFTVPSLIGIATHQAVIDRIKIQDTSINLFLTPKCVDSGQREWGSGHSLSVFQIGENYQHSTWLWQRYGDTEFTMTIWGPDDMGNYEVELGRTSGHPFVVYYNYESVFIVHAVTDYSNDRFEGYYVFSIVS